MDARKVTHKIPISNILAYLGDILPPLDAEGGSASSQDKIDHSLSVVLSGEGHGLCVAVFVTDLF